MNLMTRCASVSLVAPRQAGRGTDGVPRRGEACSSRDSVPRRGKACSSRDGAVELQSAIRGRFARRETGQRREAEREQLRRRDEAATSLAAGVTSWNAHDDLAKRIQRYTNAVRSIERLQWWWRSLGVARSGGGVHSAAKSSLK